MRTRLRLYNKYMKWGLTAFLVIAFSIIFFFLIYRHTGFKMAFDKFVAILMPFIFGLVMAYLICPLFDFVVRQLIDRKWVNYRGPEHARRLSKAIGTIVSLLAILGIFVGICALIIPSTIKSIVDIATVLPDQIATLNDYLQHIPKKFSEFSGPISEQISKVSGYFIKWVENSVMPHYGTLLSGVGEIGMGIVNFFKNFFVGLIICVFFLNGKEVFAAQTRKLILATFTENHADNFLRGAAFANKTFGGFINGKLLDSLIIGIICFTCMIIFKWPYAVLISVIIAVTNIIPFFGPFIGAIPSAMLLFLEDPKLALYFIIFVLVLQQFDGNILGPKILGSSTGLSSFWVIFAILIFGGLFGPVGMILGTPIFAVIYAYACYAVNRRLEKKGLSTDLRDYKSFEKLGKGKELVKKKDEE